MHVGGREGKREDGERWRENKEREIREVGREDGDRGREERERGREIDGERWSIRR